ncbi:hypothetical protein [Brucella rhizosphaerae]|uniref:C1q domain-containing protein n=1 Tax=Brucella rhizosphaerae TaxID=571254 RepID=A0A256FHI7_9HYPH|nr:hypothetical protein [Brucella rhizosphaerae]OYR14289.1 hypothetical protein CEV32_0287 [Brucella rhizosphaerae]
MAYQDRFYTIGDVTVQNGSAVVTGTGTGWETALIDGGVIFVGGGCYPVYSVESETSLTLAYPFTDASGADLPYAIDRQRAAATSNIQMNDRLAQIIREISIGNIEQFNALTLAPDKLLHTNSNKALTQSDITAAAIALLNLSGAAAADRLPYFNSAAGAALTPLTPLARNLLDDTTTASMRATISPGKPAFKAHLAANQLVYNGTTNLSYTASPINIGNAWNGSIFTAPEAGNYFFSMGNTLIDGNNGQFILQVFVNGTVSTEIVWGWNSSGVQYYRAGTLSHVVNLAVGSTVQFKLVLDGLSGNPAMQAFRNFAMGFMI